MGKKASLILAMTFFGVLLLPIICLYSNNFKSFEELLQIMTFISLFLSTIFFLTQKQRTTYLKTKRKNILPIAQNPVVYRGKKQIWLPSITKKTFHFSQDLSTLLKKFKTE